MIIHKHMEKRFIIIKMPHHTLAGKKQNLHSDLKQ